MQFIFNQRTIALSTSAILAAVLAGCGGGGGETTSVSAPVSESKTLLAASTYSAGDTAPVMTLAVGSKGSIDLYRDAADTAMTQAHITSPKGEFSVTQNATTGQVVVRNIATSAILKISITGANRIDYRFFDGSGTFKSGFALFHKNDKVYFGEIQGVPVLSTPLVINGAESSTVMSPSVDAALSNTRELTAAEIAALDGSAQTAGLLDFVMSSAHAAAPAWWTELVLKANASGRAAAGAKVLARANLAQFAQETLLVSAAATGASLCATFSCTDASSSTTASRWTDLKATLAAKWTSTFDIGGLFELSANTVAADASGTQSKALAPAFSLAWTEPQTSSLPVATSSYNGTMVDNIGQTTSVTGSISAAGEVSIQGTGIAVTGQFDAAQQAFSGTYNGAAVTGSLANNTPPPAPAVWKTQTETLAPLQFTPQAGTLTETSNLSNAVFKPAGDGPFPAVVVVHTCGGVTRPHIRTHVKELVDAGYVVLSTDSYGPRGFATCRNQNTVLASAGAMDAFAALAHLNTMPIVDPSRIYLTGYSFGGMTAAMVSSARAAEVYGSTFRFRATVANYGSCFLQTSASGTLSALLQRDTDRPVLMLMASEDTELKPQHCFPTIRALKALGRPVEWHIYQGATHAWDQFDLPPNYTTTTHIGETVVYNYDAAVTQDATQRMLAFFNTHR